MENNFFSLNRENDWKTGIQSNIEIKYEKIQIAASKRYVYEKAVSLNLVISDENARAYAVGDNGVIYYIDAMHKIMMYDLDTGISELVSNRNYDDSDIKLKYANRKLYIKHKSINNKYEVDVISTETGTLADRIDVADSEDAKIIGFYVDNTETVYMLTQNGILYCINKTLNIKDKYDLGKLINKNFKDLAESRIIIKGYKNENIYFYNKNCDEFTHINLQSSTVNTKKFENISSIGVFKDYVIINKEDIKPTVYRYDLKNYAFEKMPYLAGKSDEIEFDRCGKIYVYNFEKNIITIMSEKEGFNYNSYRNANIGIYYTKIFDSNKEGVMWDKIAIDAKIPSDCMISVMYYAYDEHELFLNNRKCTFSDFISDEKINIFDKEAVMEKRWQGSITNMSKALLRNAAGRYLVIKIELWGSNINTPCVEKLRVYYDRKTYTSYLPQIYESENKDSFLDRYLSLFETFLQDIEEKIDFISDNFDADKAAPDMLRFLCGWLDLEVDSTWTDEKIRKLITRAPHIFKKRGTKDSISEILEIYLGQKPIIAESFQIDKMRQNSEMKNLINSLYDDNPYSFTVMVKPLKELTDDEKTAIKRILDNESPAYCTYKFIVLESWMALDKHTYLGINSQILNWSYLKLDGKSILPYNAILANKQVI